MPLRCPSGSGEAPHDHKSGVRARALTDVRHGASGADSSVTPEDVMQRQRTQHHKPRRARLGLLTPEQLLVHRELELLRVAGQPRPRSRAAQRRHSLHMERRARKLDAAQRAYAAAVA